MSPSLEIARELLRALADLLLAPPRALAFALGRRRRLREFQGLAASPAPREVEAPAPPARPLRRILLSCGDASGEIHARALLRELRARHPGLQVAGFGGAALAREGMEVWEPLADWNVMGFRDVAARLPRFVACVARFARELRERPPDLVLLVDYPGLHRHLIRLARRAGVPVVQHIAPQLWAWAPWRVRDFRRADLLTVILPFEEDWYRRRGAPARYVGHPLGDRLAAGTEEEARAPELDPGRPWVGILPGSRRREIRNHLPLLLEAARRLKERRPEVGFVLPHLREECWPGIEAILAAAPDLEVVRARGAFHGVLPRLRAAWVASGTALLETAAWKVPPVLLYRLSGRGSAFLARHLLAVPHVGSLNLLAGEELVPEHVGPDPDPGALARDLEARLEGPVREDFLRRLEPRLPGFARPGTARRTALAVEELFPTGDSRRGTAAGRSPGG